MLNVPLSIDNKNQLDFESKTEQYNYFNSKQVSNFNFDDCSYLRKDNVLKVPVHLDDIWNCNYLMYRNTNFNTKWFYAFIVNKEYISDNCTACTIQTDVFQTWMFDYTFKRSFVEREMIAVSSDTPRC